MTGKPDKSVRKGIYILPNLFTTGALFAGFSAIIQASNGKFELAAILIFVAMVLDGLDGRVARMTNTTSEFGIQYDSLSDMVSFGLAPALVVYEWSLNSMGKLGWMLVFIYAVAAALRLARFNTHAADEKIFFQGLPSPSAAAIIASFIWVVNDYGMSGAEFKIPILLLTLTAAILMVSNVPFRSFKDFDLKSHVPFVVLLGIVIALVVIVYDPPRVLFAGFFIYLVSGPVTALLHRKKKGGDQGDGDDEGSVPGSD
ncbi:MAG: CDP-diacylglycerol--serine O-phosphatidyltransferase [Pseudomonadota bacterium]|nr:CDP-diacylglycerol--serine O-phosphatidyltransferase [Pseudomonadota bacterium]